MRASTRGKARRAGVINRPIVTETHRRLALQLRMAVEALIGAGSPDTYNQVSKILAALIGAGLAGAALDLGNVTMAAVCDRFERVGKVGVSAAEAAALRQAAAGIDAGIALLPLNRVARAIAEVEVFCVLVGA